MKTLTLTQRVLEVLRACGGVVSHEALLGEVWGPYYRDDAENRQLLRVAVNRLRRELVGTCEYVVTHQRRGYSLTQLEPPSLGAYPYARHERHRRPSGGARARAARERAPA